MTHLTLIMHDLTKLLMGGALTNFCMENPFMDLKIYFGKYLINFARLDTNLND